MGLLNGLGTAAAWRAPAVADDVLQARPTDVVKALTVNPVAMCSASRGAVRPGCGISFRRFGDPGATTQRATAAT